VNYEYFFSSLLEQLTLGSCISKLPGVNSGRKIPVRSTLISFNKWIDHERIELEASPFVAINEEGEADATPSCVKEATPLSFDAQE
jgi:hypothetical protein